MKLLIMQFSPTSHHFISLRSKYSPLHPVLIYLQSIIGETTRYLELCIKEHKYNLTQGLLEKSKLAQHA
jgi:hypothetical protein